MSDDRRTPSWAMLDAARKALQPPPEDGLLALTDAELLRDYWRALGDRNAGLATVPAVGEDLAMITAHEAQRAAYAASIRSLGETDLLQRWEAAWSLVVAGVPR